MVSKQTIEILIFTAMKIWITTSICSALFLFYGFGKTPIVSSSNDALFISVELENTTLKLDTFFIPTAITPNKDGLNDNFSP